MEGFFSHDEFPLKIEFYKHNLGSAEKNLINEVLDSVFLTTGPKTRQFESRFAECLGLKAALGMTSWTNAAFLVLKAWGIKEGDQVIVPSLSFVASANVILHCGARPVFCDSEKETGNLDVKKLTRLVTKKTKANMPVHLYGQMADMQAIHRFAKKHQLKILEDCAHCILGKRDGVTPGLLGDAAVFSFYATKNITCGEGGAVASQNPELIEELKLLRLHGMTKSATERYTSRYQHWDMDVLGFKANMNDLQAALLLPQLERMDELRKKRESICRYYETRFSKAGIRFPKVLKDSISDRHLFTIWVDPKKRDFILAQLQDQGLGVAVNFRAIHTLSYYRKFLRGRKFSLSVAEEIGNSTITIPMYPKLTDAEREFVAETVIGVVNKNKDIRGSGNQETGIQIPVFGRKQKKEFKKNVGPEKRQPDLQSRISV